MPTTFWIIIAFQVIVYIAVYFYKRHTQKYLPASSVLFISAIFGFLLGMVFDYMCIYFSTHTYFLENGSLIPSSTAIPFKHLLSNGVLSYGLYVATLYYFQSFSNEQKPNRKKVYLPLTLLIVGIFCTYFFIPESIIQTMILVGLCVVTFGEIIALLCRVCGPVVEVIVFRRYSQFFRGYLPSVAIALFYESANHFSPFWVWAPYTHYPSWIIEGLIIMFGYYILTHPIIIFWKIVKRHKIPKYSLL